MHLNILAPLRRVLQKSTVLWATPLLGMIFFIMAMAAFLYVMHRQDAQQTHDTLIRDVEMARQTLRVRLHTTQDRVTQMARDVGQETIDDTGFLDRARTLLDDSPELHQIGLMDREHYSRWGVTRRGKVDNDLHRADERIEDAESYWAFVTAKDSGRAVYSRPFMGPGSEIYIELHAPVYSSRGSFQGTVYAAAPINSLLLEVLPKTFQTRYLFNIIDGGGNPVASNGGGRSLERALDAYEVTLDPPGQGLRMRAIALISNSRLMQNTLAWVVVGLSIIVIWSFLMLMRHAAARARAEASLLAEAEFRRAVENSVSTGLQVFDLHGRITYVNPAFLRMTGLAESELVGKSAPFPYWPMAHREEQMRNLDMVLSGLAPANGIELKMQRRDTHLFDARMYVSPLINGQGTQTGWMTSITDITEPRRIREELAAAHERFTTVLEEMDAAISVSAPTGKGVRDLLFANRLHRDWFSQCLTDGALGEADLINATGPGVFECYWTNPPRWYEVRRRTITWVDGRWVSMDVSTDITERKQSAESAKSQQEKLQFTSRLVTMGEMASLLAHELNQPLAAISNYSMGSVSRIKAGKTGVDELLPVLEKTTQQALRAGNVIRRIREFVKRKAPDRKACQLSRTLDDAIAFADMDARNRNIHLELNTPPGTLPDVFADPILIEQVILNLLKNAMDATVAAQNGPRRVSLEVVRDEDLKSLRIRVKDHGCGIPEDIRERLFEPFFSTKTEGMGMGLNICRSIIEYHDSRLEIMPNVPQGSIFQFTLPIWQEEIHQTRSENQNEPVHPINADAP